MNWDTGTSTRGDGGEVLVVDDMQMLDVIIPTLNAASTLPATLACLDQARVCRVIVVDGGSGDDTVAIAAQSGAETVRSTPGRGRQLRAGAARATSAWLLFLHADTVLELGAWDEIAALVAGPGGRAGYFRLALDDVAPAARRLERLVAWRCRVLALPYGDQGLLIPAALYRLVGGHPDIALMEDVALARRLGRLRLHALASAAVTGAARYRKDGYLRRSAHNIVLLALFFCGVPPARLARLYNRVPSRKRR